MRLATAAGERRPIPGFERRGSEGRPMSAASKTRPLQRAVSGSVLLLRSDYGLLLPSRLTVKALNSKVKERVKSWVRPVVPVNTSPLYHALNQSAVFSSTTPTLASCTTQVQLSTVTKRSKECGMIKDKGKRPSKLSVRLTRQQNFVSVLRDSFSRSAPRPAAFGAVVRPEHRPMGSLDIPKPKPQVKRRRIPRSIEVRIDQPFRARMSTESAENGTRDSAGTPTSKRTFVSQSFDICFPIPPPSPKQHGPSVHFSPQ